MKKLQNNFTTPEQSKRLLELGVPVDSADSILRHYAWAEKNLDGTNWETPIVLDGNLPASVALEMYVDDEYDYTQPCWSVGRLMDITKICITDKDALTEIFELLRDCTFITRNLCQVFEEYSDVLDFSKLEK